MSSSPPPLLSIVVPVYNVASYLRQCLDSIVTQTLSDIEIILVNDGSTDNSGDICKYFASRDSRIHLIEQKNCGLAAARNAGLLVANGKYIGFVDSDDWIEPNMYERMVRTATEHECDIVWANVYRNESEKQQRFLSSGLYQRSDIERHIFPRLLAVYNERTRGEGVLRGSVCLRVYRHSLIKKHQILFGPNFRHSEDLPFNFECTIHANRYYYLGEDYLYHHRLNMNSLSQGYVFGMWSLIKPLIIHLQEIVRSYDNYDFSSQMNIRVFLSTITCVDNELKPSNTNTFRQRLHIIRELAGDPLVREALHRFHPKGMKRINWAYYWGFRYRLSLLVYGLAWYRRWRQRQNRERRVK